MDVIQRAEGYRLVGAFEQAPVHAVAVAGFRLGHTLAWGASSTSTTSRRSPRHVGAATDAASRVVDEEARRLGCDQLHLDSGVGVDRIDAHRLYFNAGLAISSFHFARRLH